MINLYTIQNNNPVTCCIIYAKPITDFNLRSNSDVTALHLAEHCAFRGNQTIENTRCKQAYQFGKGSLEAKITKQWIGFIFSFYTQFYQDAIIWFFQFINELQTMSDIQEFNDRKKELEQELANLTPIYQKCSTIRKKIFYNLPYKLSSGGELKFVNKVSLSQVNLYKKQLSFKGQYILTTPKSAKLNNFQQFQISNYLKISHVNPLKVEINKYNYFDSSSCIFVLPAISSQERLFLLGFFDYFRNSYDCFDLDCEISLFSNLSVIYLIKKNINAEFQLLIDFVNDDGKVEKAKSFALSSMQEDLRFTQSVAEDAVLDWVNGQFKTEFNFNKLLTDLNRVLKSNSNIKSLPDGLSL